MIAIGVFHTIGINGTYKDNLINMLQVNGLIYKKEKVSN